jgi:hypothetical protein
MTYFGASRATMETEHTAIATQFAVSENSAFLGQAIHDYNAGGPCVKSSMATSPLPQSLPEFAVVLAFDTTEMALEDTRV